jgi:murein DD-endopeptidase MepM/ murein hydrolase activator NlpD
MRAVPPISRVAHCIQEFARRAGSAWRARRGKWQLYTFSGALRGTAAGALTWRHRHWLLAGLALVCTAVLGVVLPGFANATLDPDAAAYTVVPLALPPLPAPDPARAPAPIDDDADWQTVRVRAGQTLGDIFREQGFAAGDLQRLLNDQANAGALRHIRPGEEFAFLRRADGGLAALRFDRDDRTRVIARFDDAGLRQEIIPRALEHRTHVAHGVIESSLFDAGAQAGLSNAMVLKLANAFGYDIDFAQDLRQGDSFTVIYDMVYCDGERLHDGDIVAATFVNRGKRFSAFRYTDASGATMFYSDDGRPLRKSFLRTPLEFSRITSYFTAARLHPILGTMRAHQGVDYAAPTGTPIHAAGDGKVAFRGWQGGYGNVVILQHGGHYSTLYGHMSRIAPLHVGQHVAQGQTIGYVGMTGLATGPHLHYEFRIDGAHRNPLTVTLPKPDPLPAPELARFKRETAPLLAKLKALEATQLALAN